MIRENAEFIFGYWKIDGEYYKETTRLGKLVLKKVNKKKIEDNIEIATKISKKLKDNLDAHKVLMESILKLEDRDIKKLYKLLFNSERDYTSVTRSHHCVDMKIGNFILPIVN